MAPDPLHVAYSLLTLEPGRPGGSETNVRGVLGEFAAGGVPGLDVTVLVTDRVGAAYADYAAPGVRLSRVSRFPGAASPLRRAVSVGLGPAFAPAARHALPGPVDVSHYPLTVPAPPLPRPRVVSLHDTNHLDLPHLWSRGQRLYRRFAYDGAARSADQVITLSAYSRDRMVDVLGIEPDRVHVIGLGIDHDRYRPESGPDDDAVVSRLGLPERYVLYPAALWPHKNHARLLEGFAQVADRDLELVLTGQAHGAWPRLEAQASALGIGGRVRHLGFVETRWVAPLYRRAQAVVFPSLYEGFGAPPLEAMACGCPVAASLEASLRELCEGAVVPLVPTDPASITAAIDAVVSDAELRARLVTAGRERAARFTWRAAAEAHAGVYRRARAGAQR